jgi:biotin transporter BioY
MYIIAIGWLYVVLMMAITAKSFFTGFMTFLWLGVLPLALFLWVVGTPARKRKKLHQAAEQPLGKPDRTDTKAD